MLLYLHACIVYTYFRSDMQKKQRCVFMFVCGKDVASTTQGQHGVKGSLAHSCWSLISIEWRVSSVTSSIWTAHVWPWTCGEMISILRIRQVSNCRGLQPFSGPLLQHKIECSVLSLAYKMHVVNVFTLIVYNFIQLKSHVLYLFITFSLYFIIQFFFFLWEGKKKAEAI